MSFRDFSNNSKIELTYKKMIQNQTSQYVSNMKRLYLLPPFIRESVWNMMDRMNNIYDESDPDTSNSQLIHSFQTGEELSSKLVYTQLKKIRIRDIFGQEQIDYKYPEYLHQLYSISDWSWLPLVGFIHDMGKVLLLDDLGKLEQWSVVGDTFPVDAILDDNFPYSKYKNTNKSLSTVDLYKEECGFDNINFSWGHDEYLAQVIERSQHRLPPEAIYLIRYHSFYSWHSPRNGKRGYCKFASQKDWTMLPLLKLFSQCDLYSKKNNLMCQSELIKKYKRLYNTFFKTDKLEW